MIGIWLLVVGDSPEGALVRSGHEWEVAPRNIQLERSYFYDEADFRIGGKDVFRCGPQGDPKFRGETRYLLIVPNVRVVSSETPPANALRWAAIARLSLSVVLKI